MHLKGGIKRAIVNIFATKLYSFSMKRANSIIFQNLPNKKLFAEKGIIQNSSKSYVINGQVLTSKSFLTSVQR